MSSFRHPLQEVLVCPSCGKEAMKDGCHKRPEDDTLCHLEQIVGLLADAVLLLNDIKKELKANGQDR